MNSTTPNLRMFLTGNFSPKNHPVFFTLPSSRLFTWGLSTLAVTSVCEALYQDTFNECTSDLGLTFSRSTHLSLTENWPVPTQCPFPFPY